MSLFDTVYQYYQQHFDELTPGKQFHFTTRIGAWRGDAWVYKHLSAVQDELAANPLAVTLRALIEAPRENDSNAHELRAPHLAKYPRLSGLNKALFRVRHLEAVYGIDAREALFAAAPQAEFIALRDALYNDPTAVSVLSTIAINYFYLLERIVYRHNDTLPLTWFYDLGDRYDLTNKQHIQLLIYLYTHCIIGDTNFYTKHIPDASLDIYRRMLQRLDNVIAENFDEINLDNKLEFLVCARICKFTATTAERIYDECAKSLSPDGAFLVDTLNNNQQTGRDSFTTSEHRNVLFIMSGTPYKPHSLFLGDSVK